MMPDSVPANEVRSKKSLSDSVPANGVRSIKSLCNLAGGTLTQTMVIFRMGIHCFSDALGPLNDISAK